MPKLLLLFGIAAVLGVLLPAAAMADKERPVIGGMPPAGQPDFGVIFEIPDDKTSDADVLNSLAEIKREGYRHINISSWIWSDLSRGSSLRRRVDMALDWCDRNNLGVWVLENIQYGGGEAGDFDKGVADPAGYVRPYVTNWVDALRGHKCVRGISLGNEVGPAIPADPNKAPLYARTFEVWLENRYGSIATLDATWGASYKSFDEIGFPAEKTPGRVDLQHFADERFGKFYDVVFDTVIKPVLGNNLGYGSKTVPDPYLYRAYPGATVAEWDDLVANEPLWVMRVLSDTDARPPFNSELHLYNDDYLYYPSVELTRYRYLTDILGGETINSSFYWGRWNNPAIAAIHSRTPAALREADRVGPQLNRFARATRTARIGVLVTQPLFDQSSENLSARPVLTAGDSSSIINRQDIALSPAAYEDAYAAFGTTGEPYRFVLDLDLAAQSKRLDALIVPGNKCLPSADLAALVALPHSVRVEWAGQWPSENEYGQPLNHAVLAALSTRCRHNADLYQAEAGYYRDKTLDSFYTATALVRYDWWSPEKGHFGFDVRYPRVEARKVLGPGTTVVTLLINHTRAKVEIPAASKLPWFPNGYRIYDLTGETWVDPSKPIVLPPFDVHLFRYVKQ